MTIIQPNKGHIVRFKDTRNWHMIVDVFETEDVVLYVLLRDRKKLEVRRDAFETSMEVATQMFDPNLHGAMSMEQFYCLMNRIEEFHKFGEFRHSVGIKYIRPNIDMRDKGLFEITFESNLGKMQFDHHQEDMFSSILLWLDTAHASFIESFGIGS